MISNAIAQASSLPPVSQTSGIDWFLLLGIAVVIGIVVLVVYLKRKNPTVVTAAGTAISTDAAHLASVISAEFGKLRTLVEAKVAPAPVAAPAADPAPAAPAGKQGVAGVFSLTVTGDAKADLAAIQAQYFG